MNEKKTKLSREEKEFAIFAALHLTELAANFYRAAIGKYSFEKALNQTVALVQEIKKQKA